MSRYRRGGKTKRQDRPSSVHRQQSLGRLSHWYTHKPIVTVDQLHKYRRKEFGVANDDDLGAAAVEQPPISLSASPSFDTEYRCRFEPPYTTAEEMSQNRRHAAVPKDELQVEGDAEFSPEYAGNYKDVPRERNLAPRQGSHIGQFVCADDPAPEGMAFESEQHGQYVAHPEGRRADNLRPSTGLRMDDLPMDGESEQMANYRKYPTTPHPDAVGGRKMKNEAIALAPMTESSYCHGRRSPFDESMKEMILTRDSGMLLRSVHPFFVVGGLRKTERSGSVKRPPFRLEVVDCSSGCGSDGGGVGRRSDDPSFVVLEEPEPVARSHYRHGTGSPAGRVNAWVKRRQRNMGTARFLDNLRPAFDASKSIQ